MPILTEALKVFLDAFKNFHIIPSLKKTLNFQQCPQITRQLVSEKLMHSEEIPYIAKLENIQGLIFLTSGPNSAPLMNINIAIYDL